MENSQIIGSGSTAVLLCHLRGRNSVSGIWCAGPSVRNAGQNRILFIACGPTADALSGLIRTEVPARVMLRT